MDVHHDPIDYDHDDHLDRGLLAAFGAADAATLRLNQGGVLGTLESRLGVQSRILLRDEPDEGRIIRPGGPTRPQVPTAAGRYQVHGEIARGGVGVVLKGRDTDLGRDVAMKVLQERHASNPALVQRFVEEAQIAGQLQHPGILPVYELGLHEEREPFFTMKLVKGDTLATLLKDTAERRDDSHRARMLSIFEDVCQTIAYAHSRGVIHRDLKPSNVMVGAFGEVQVVDWGLAKVLGQGDAHQADEPATVIETDRSRDPGSRSVVGSVMGTPAYMAPEQARGETSDLDERADVFSLGAMLCEILTGEPPFTGDASSMMADAAAGRVDGAMTRLDQCGADEDLIQIARSCLAADRRARPASAKSVAEAVRDYRASVEQRVRQATIAAAEAATRATQERKARRLTLALALAVLSIIVVGGLAFAAFKQSQQERTAKASEQLDRALNDASVLFGQAQAAPVGQTEAWALLNDAEADLRALMTDEISPAARKRATAFLADLEIAQRDRTMIERIEELVIFGATHDDAQSWVWMEESLRHAYVEYGLDLDNGDRTRIAEQIRASPLRAQLTNGLELWIATVFHLSGWGLNPRPIPDMLQWVETLYDADPDPYRSAIRRILYSANPAEHVDTLNELAESDEFDSALPRTKAWLASTYFRTGDVEKGVEIFKRALDTDPDDFMLNFDCAYYLVALKRWDEATRYYHRALTTRPDSGGVWRSLGIALRELDDLDGAIDAFDRSIVFQPDHAPTHVDRGATLHRMGRMSDAIDALTRAVELAPESAIAHCRLGLAQQDAGRLEAALKSLRRGHELGTETFGWDHPSDEWIRACERLLDQR